MKRLSIFIAVTFSVSLMLMASLKQSSAEQQALAESYLSQGFYDEAMQAYHHANLHIHVVKATIHYLGEFNAFLAILGFVFILAGLFLRKPVSHKAVPQIRFNRDFINFDNSF